MIDPDGAKSEILIADDDGEDAVFGAFRPTPQQEAIRRLTHRLPYNYAGRKLASLLLGLAGGRAGACFDVPVFSSQAARLHPKDNICEKRVYITPDHWDPEERAILESRIERSSGADFFFLDVGANVGLYSLFARAVAARTGLKFHAACVEADPEMRRRLGFNVAASGAENDFVILPYAAAATRARLSFTVHSSNRGMSRLDADGAHTVQGAPLIDMIRQETNFPRIDAMKIDIEGAEEAVLRAFFDAAPAAMAPLLAIVETSHESKAGAIAALFKDAGYGAVFNNDKNAVFARGP